MGCDIHMCFERLNYKNQWVTADRFVCDYDDDRGWFYAVDPIYSDRDYELFTFLAGVRNYYGREIPVNEPRGLPEDASPQTREYSDSYGIDGHSHSWMTVKELFEKLNAIETVHRKGYISQEQFRELKEEGIKPSSWFHYITRPDFVECEWVDSFVGKERLGNAVKNAICRGTYYDSWESFINNEYQTPDLDRYRIVFFFDN